MTAALFGARKYLLKGFGPVLTVDVPQIPSVLDLVVSDFLVLQPDNEIPELCFICGKEETRQELKNIFSFDPIHTNLDASEHFNH